MAARQGQAAQAKEYLEEGLALARELGPPERLCLLLRLAGEIALQEHIIFSIIPSSASLSAVKRPYQSPRRCQRLKC